MLCVLRLRGRGLAELSSEATLAKALEGLVTIVIGLDLNASPAVLTLHLPAVLAPAVLVLAKVSPVASWAGAEKRLLRLLCSLNFNARPTILALDLLAVPSRGSVQLTLGPMIVFMAGAKLRPVSCNTTCSPVLAVIVGTVGILLLNGSR